MRSCLPVASGYRSKEERDRLSCSVSNEKTCHRDRYRYRSGAVAHMDPSDHHHRGSEEADETQTCPSSLFTSEWAALRRDKLSSLCDVLLVRRRTSRLALSFAETL